MKNLKKTIMILIIFVICLLMISICEGTASSTITLTTNSGGVIGAKVTMTNSSGNKSHIYKQTAKGASVLFKKNVPGTYTVIVEHDDYFPCSKSGVTVHNTVPGYTVNLLKNGPATIKISAIGGSANGAYVVIKNEEGKTLQAKLQGESVIFQRLIQGNFVC